MGQAFHKSLLSDGSRILILSSWGHRERKNLKQPGWPIPETVGADASFFRGEQQLFDLAWRTLSQFTFPVIHNRVEVGMKRSSLRDIILSLAAGGLEIFERTAGRHHEDILAMCARLLHLKGEASAISFAHEILTAYQSLSMRNRLQFFERLLSEFGPDSERVDRAIVAYQREPTTDTLFALQTAAESPRQELFRLLNMGPDGTASIISMRQDLRTMLLDRPQLKVI